MKKKKLPYVCLKHPVRITFPDGTHCTAMKGTLVTLIAHQFVFESLSKKDWRDLQNGICRDMPVPGSLFSKNGGIRIKIGKNIVADIDLRALYDIATLFE